MFYAIEKYKLPAQILLGLIALTFVGFGASTLAQPGQGYVAKVGDIPISEQDVNDATRQLQAAGDPRSREAIFQGLMQQAYLQQGGLDLGVNISLEQVKQVIASDPGFQENGGFSEARYRAFLQQRHMTEAMLIEDMRKQFAIQSVLNLVQGGVLVSDVQAGQMINRLQAVRQVRMADFAPKDYADKINVDAAALQAYYNAQKAQYEQAQAVKFEYVVLSAKTLGDKAAVSEEELQQAYAQMPADASAVRPSLDSVKAQLTEDIRLRKGRQALAQKREELADLVFNRPDSLKTAAEKLGLKIEQYDEWLTAEAAKAQGMPADLQAALFSDDVLVKKQNSEPLAVSSDAVWVVRASAVRPKRLATFDEVKEQVRADYTRTESLKLALAAAKTALQQAEKGNIAGINWSPVSALTAEQARSAMPAADFQQLLKARPQAGKSAYVLLNDKSAPVLLEVQSIAPPANAQQSLPEVKKMLAENEADTLMAGYLQQLQRRYPPEQGAQKIDGNSE